MRMRILFLAYKTRKMRFGVQVLCLIFVTEIESEKVVGLEWVASQSAKRCFEEERSQAGAWEREKSHRSRLN
jgi:hypothetical protein